MNFRVIEIDEVLRDMRAVRLPTLRTMPVHWVRMPLSSPGAEKAIWAMSFFSVSRR